MAHSIKAFVRKTVTEEYLDKAPVRDASGALRFPPNEPGKGPWEISLVKPHKRAPQPTSVLFKRKTVYFVPNPRLTAKNRNSAMQYLQSARISENMVASNSNNNNTYGRTTRRAKSEYGRHLLGNFGPAPANGSNNANNLSNFASRLKISGAEGGKRQARQTRRSS
jgi:hypothetical protein